MVGEGSDEVLFIIRPVSGFDRRRHGAGKVGGCLCIRTPTPTRNPTPETCPTTRHLTLCFVRRHSLLVVHYWTKVQYTSTTFRSIV